MLESARGPVPNLAEAVAGAPIRGNWWGHKKAQQIFRLTRAVRDSSDVLVCRILGHKVTYVHRRLWPALVRLASRFARADLAAFREIHTAEGKHVLRMVPFPRWVPSAVRRQARKLTEAQARTKLGDLWPTQSSASRRPRLPRPR
jgi:hypothetical protein